MLKCKFAEQNPQKCGLTICCCKCENYATCSDSCERFDADASEDEVLTCDEAYLQNEVVLLTDAVPEVIVELSNLCKQQKAMDELMKVQKQKLLEAMEKFGVKSFDNDVIKVTYVAPTTRTSIDSAKLKKDHPDIAEQYSKVSNVSASVRISVK